MMRKPNPQLGPVAIADLERAHRRFYATFIVHLTPSPPWRHFEGFLIELAEHGITSDTSGLGEALNANSRKDASSLLAAVKSRNAPAAAIAAARLSHLFLHYGWDSIYGEDFHRGEEVLAGARRGGQRRGEANASRNRSIQELMDGLMQYDENDENAEKPVYSKVARTVARKFNVNPKTVQRIAPNPRPRSRKKS